MAIMSEFTQPTPDTMMHDTTPNKEITLEEVQVFAERNRIAANSSISKCVDGRYRTGEADGAIAFAGAHLGLSMSLLAYGFTPEESFSLVYDFLQSRGESYCWHTDDHADPKEADVHEHAHHDAPKIGCGHCNAAIENSTFYGAQSGDVDSLQHIVRTAQESREGMETITLTGGHAEKAILLVTSTDYTVKSWDEEMNEQFFIYDRTRHLELVDALVEHINASIMDETKKVSADRLKDIAWKQTASTLGLLSSSKGKPIFSVDASEVKPVVTPFGKAPTSAEVWQ